MGLRNSPTTAQQIQSGYGCRSVKGLIFQNKGNVKYNRNISIGTCEQFSKYKRVTGEGKQPSQEK